MNIGEAVIRSVDWPSFRVATGDASQVGDTLSALLRCRTTAEYDAVWPRIENVIFAQDTIYSAAEPAIDVLMAALADETPPETRNVIIDLLFLLVHGGSIEDPDLVARCHARARKGVWLLVREAARNSPGTRETILETLDLIDPPQADALRSWFAS